MLEREMGFVLRGFICEVPVETARLKDKWDDVVEEAGFESSHRLMDEPSPSMARVTWFPFLRRGMSYRVSGSRNWRPWSSTGGDLFRVFKWFVRREVFLVP